LDVVGNVTGCSLESFLFVGFGMFPSCCCSFVLMNLVNSLNNFLSAGKEYIVLHAECYLDDAYPPRTI
jgi:hypothetical protein